MRDSAIQSRTFARVATGSPNVTRASARVHISSSARSAAPIARMQWWMRPGPEAGLGDHEAVALARDQVRRRARARPRTLISPWPSLVDGSRTPAGCARRVTPGVSSGHEDHRLLLRRARPSGSVLPITMRIRQRGCSAPDDPPLAAVEDVVVAVALDAQSRCCVASERGDVGLGHRERRADLAVEQRAQPALLLLRRAELVQHLHVAGVGRRAVARLGGDVRAAHDLGERRVVDVGQARRRARIGQEQVPQPALARLVLELLHDRRRMECGSPASRELLLVDRLGRDRRARP